MTKPTMPTTETIKKVLADELKANKKEIREEEEKFKMFPNYETSKERNERRKEELNK